MYEIWSMGHKPFEDDNAIGVNICYCSKYVQYNYIELEKGIARNRK